MNYRHHFHAGNFADVLKHVVLRELWRALQRKPKALLYLDTHAGRGRYDLTRAAVGDRLERTPEWPDGIGRLIGREDLPAAVADYVGAVRSWSGGEDATGAAALQDYPGSPWLVQPLMRAEDRAVLTELHPEESALLEAEFHGVPRVRVLPQNGYDAVRAHLPPKERRALVLIDPPYESGDEISAVVTALETGLARLPGGTFAVWYPLTERARVNDLLARVERLKPPPTWIAEIEVVGANQGGPRMRGCGLLVVNPPWKLDEELASTVAWLGEALAQGPGATASLRWLVPES